MQYPSKRAHAIAQVERRRKAAVQANDTEAFAACVAEIQDHEANTPDDYTCACCAEDFPATDAHIEILAAAVLVFPGGEGEIERYDYGINDVARGDAPGRRFKFCGDCAAEWKIHARDYIEMR